uniref:Transmembrane protein 238 n=1 Tax=Mus musculus TaxID=10090 RepID=Q9D7T0_MOUSE|nr:unnamed protein product [Mus musculus]
MAAAPPVCGSQASAVGASSPPAPAPAPAAGLGRCRMALLLAVALDVAGMAALLTGVFAQLQVRGRDFGDLLIYSGALLVFLSLLGWILWYTAHIEISRQELERDLRPTTLGDCPPGAPSCPVAGRCPSPPVPGPQSVSVQHAERTARPSPPLPAPAACACSSPRLRRGPWRQARAASEPQTTSSSGPD